MLVISPNKVGDTLAIQFTEPSGTRNQWRLVVRINTTEGDYNLGAVVTRPPYGTGDPAARVVALASHPGVKGWRVMAYGPRGAVARLSLSTRHLATGGTFGIVPVNGSQVISNRWSPSPNVGAKTVQGIATDGPGVVLEGYGYRDPAAIGLVYFGFVDKATAIVNGDLFIVAPFPVPPPVGVVPGLLAWNFGDGVVDGLRFAAQARWCVSSTDNLVTLAAGGDAMRVQNKVV
jgi:hypothetical protein